MKRKCVKAIALSVAFTMGTCVTPTTASAVNTLNITTAKLKGNTLTLNLNDKAQLKVKYGNKIVTTKVTYKSSNTKVASVTKKGKITAKKKGNCTIRVKYTTKVKNCKVTIKQSFKVTVHTHTYKKHLASKTIDAGCVIECNCCTNFMWVDTTNFESTDDTKTLVTEYFTNHLDWLKRSYPDKVADYKMIIMTNESDDLELNSDIEQCLTGKVDYEIIPITNDMNTHDVDDIIRQYSGKKLIGDVGTVSDWAIDSAKGEIFVISSDRDWLDMIQKEHSIDHCLANEYTNWSYSDLWVIKDYVDYYYCSCGAKK